MHTDFLFYIIKKKIQYKHVFYPMVILIKHKFNIHIVSLRYIYVLVIIQMVTFS